MNAVAVLPRMIEYGNPLARTHASTDTVLRREKRVSDYGKVIEWTLSERTPGYVAAGSAMRLQEKLVYRVTCQIDGATHGQGFTILAAAERWMSERREVIL